MYILYQIGLEKDILKILNNLFSNKRKFELLFSLIEKIFFALY